MEASAVRFPSAEWFESLAGAMREGPELGAIGHGLSLDLGVRCGEDTYLLRLREGRLVSAEPVRSESGAAPEFTICAPPDAWRKFLKPEPPAFYNNPLATASRVPGASLEGDLTVFVRHLRALNRVFELARYVESGRV